MRFILTALCLAVSAVPVALAAAKETHPFGVRDLVAFDRLSEPKVSPDGAWVVFSMSSLDLEANKRRSDLWLVRTDGSGLRALTRNDASDTSGIGRASCRERVFEAV